MTRQTNARVAAAAALLILASLGCVSSTTGKQGNLKFSYFTDDDPGDFNKPIAIGARLELKVAAAGTGAGRDVTLQSATTTDASILNVADYSGDTIVLEAKGDGGTEIKVTAKRASDGEVVEDSVDMMARKPDKHELRHTCLGKDATDGVYLVGQVIWIPFEFKLNNGSNVIGYGYYPVKHEPAEALTMKTGTKDQQYIRYTAGMTPGDVKLTSDIDGSTLNVKLIEEKDIDGIKLVVAAPINEGKTGAAYTLPKFGDQPVCQAVSDITVKTVSEEICEVNRVGDDAQGSEVLDKAPNPDRRGGWFSVRGIKAGECEFEVTYPKANGGMGVTETLKVTIAPPASAN